MATLTEFLQAFFDRLQLGNQLLSVKQSANLDGEFNPFTKEETIFEAKPTRNVVRIQAVKAVKDMV